jgi:acyl-coenzyme A synthetase/AMP-(fatty) acid ligase
MSTCTSRTRNCERQVNEVAAVLRDSLGLTTGDRVTLHMRMVPELPVTMLACARLGIIHSQVFGSFSGNACGTRIADSGSRVLITMDGCYRAGQLIDHKVKADEAVQEAAKQGQEVDKVQVWRRHPGQYASQVPMAEGRDVFVYELAGHRGKTVEPVSMPAEAPSSSCTPPAPQRLQAQSRRCGTGITPRSARARRSSSAPGGRPRPAASSAPGCPPSSR